MQEGTKPIKKMFEKIALNINRPYSDFESFIKMYGGSYLVFKKIGMRLKMTLKV